MSFLKLGRGLFENKSVIYRKNIEYEYDGTKPGADMSTVSTGAIRADSRYTERVRDLSTTAFGESSPRGEYLESLENAKIAYWTPDIDGAVGSATQNKITEFIETNNIDSAGNTYNHDGTQVMTDLHFGRQGGDGSNTHAYTSFENKVRSVSKLSKHSKFLYVSASFFDYKTRITIRKGLHNNRTWNYYKDPFSANPYQSVFGCPLDGSGAEVDKSLTPESYPGHVYSYISEDELVHMIPYESRQQTGIHDGGTHSAHSSFLFKIGADKTLRKSLMLKYVKNNLMPYYKTRYNNCEYEYVNYHCLNFFTGSTVTRKTEPTGFVTGSCLIYPNYPPGHLGRQTGAYTLNDQFTIDFWINPRYSNDPGSPFTAGTILHHRDQYAISLISGSSRDVAGLVDGYRIMVQLSDTANKAPSSIHVHYSTTGSDSVYENIDLDKRRKNNRDDVFLSPDNSLKKNHWHRVTIRWGNKFNNGYGDIIVDSEPTQFLLNSSSVNYAAYSTGSSTAGPLSQTGFAPEYDAASANRQDVLGQSAVFMGNFYEHLGVLYGTSAERIQEENVFNFFGDDACKRDGLFTEDQFRDSDRSWQIPFSPLRDRPAASTDSSGELFRHGLNGEIHDIKIYKTALTDQELVMLYDQGVTMLTGSASQARISSPAFYVPVYFTPHIDLQYDQYVSPFEVEDRFNTTPTNVNLSLGAGGKLVNLQNYTKEFIFDNLPRRYHLSSSRHINVESSTPSNPLQFNPLLTDWNGVSDHATVSTGEMFVVGDESAGPCQDGSNSFIYDYETGDGTKEARRMTNLMILPCDNGLHRPNYSIISDHELLSGSLKAAETPPQRYGRQFSQTIHKIDNLTVRYLAARRFRATEGAESFGSNITDSESFNKKPVTPSHISLRDYLHRTRETRTSINVNTPGRYGSDPGDVSREDCYEFFPYAYLTEDVDSNDVSLFSISSLYYGDRIHPGSFSITDSNVTGSGGKVSIKIQDDGRGSLYRADSETPHATWNSVGNIFYEEGLILYKSPHPLCFGKQNYKIKFKGEQTTHVAIVNVPAPDDLLSVSSNPTYQKLTSPADPANLEDNEFVYLTGVNLHDENLNVIARASFAQPIAKRKSDNYLVKLKLDY